MRLLTIHKFLAPQLKLAAIAPVLSMYTTHLSLHFDLITCYTNFLQMFSLYCDPKGEHACHSNFPYNNFRRKADNETFKTDSRLK